MKVAVYYAAGQTRSIVVAKALARGASACGDHTQVIDCARYGAPTTPVTAFYGFHPPMPRIMQEHRESGRKCVFVDLGYWARGSVGASNSHHKVTVNSRHPDEYLMARQMGGDRARALNLKVQPWRKGGKHILLCGMSAKAARSWGYSPEQWERETIDWLRRLTDRPIVYRPKPSWDGARPIKGAMYSYKSQSIHHALVDCHALVTRHSNSAVDAILAGVPVFCVEGAATPMACTDFSRIEDPVRPEGREQWMWNLTYCQWTGREIQEGVAWRHLKDEGIIP